MARLKQRAKKRPDQSAQEWRRIIGSPVCDLTMTQKWVLTVLSYYGTNDGENIFPSQAAVAERAGVTEKTVRNATCVAEKKGWLARHSHPSSLGRGYRRYEYELTVPETVANFTWSHGEQFWNPPYDWLAKFTQATCGK